MTETCIRTEDGFTIQIAASFPSAAFTLHMPQEELSSRLGLAIWNAAREADQIAERLQQKAEWMMRDLARAAEEAASGGCPNSLGVLQGSASELDILCARLNDAREHLRALALIYRDEEAQA